MKHFFKLNTSSMMIVFGLAGLALSFAFNHSSSSSGPMDVATIKSASVIDSRDHQPELEYRRIEDIRVGMRVAARNPEVTDEQRQSFVDPNPETWRFLKLEMVKADGGVLEIEMIRPLRWLAEHRAEVGNKIYLEMAELGAVGDAMILEIGPCPEIESGRGEVVISTFAHPATHKILDVTFECKNSTTAETIGVTETHPFWSVDDQAFIPIGKLEVGNRVQTIHGETKRVTNKLARPGPAQRVYNLEVNGEHVYHVGDNKLLVHNTGCGGKGKYSDVGGHHVHGKAGFKDSTKYSKSKAFSISQEYMRTRGWNHQAMTNKQRELFDELAQSGRPNTLREHTRIAVEALQAGGATRAEARALVAESLKNLRLQGVRVPTNIPWN